MFRSICITTLKNQVIHGIRFHGKKCIADRRDSHFCFRCQRSPKRRHPDHCSEELGHGPLDEPCVEEDYNYETLLKSKEQQDQADGL